MLEHLTSASRRRHRIVIAVASGLVLGALLTLPAHAQLQGQGTGWCTDHTGRNFRCRARTGQGASRNRTATIYNNRGVDLLRRGQRTKSLATVGQGIANLRRAYQIQAHWIHQRNLFAALTYYWTLRASKTSICAEQLTYLRNATKTLHYHPADKQRSLWARVRNLEQTCAGRGATTKRQKKPSTGTARRGADIGAVAAVAGDVQLCVKGRCKKVKPGQAILFNGIIVTGKTGRIQIRLTDNTIVTVGSNTQLVMGKYSYGADPLLHIKRGLIRWVSGLTGGFRKKFMGPGLRWSSGGPILWSACHPPPARWLSNCLRGHLPSS